MTFKKVCVYGSGTIGIGWAVQFALKGIDVVMYDVNEEKLAYALKEANDRLDFFSGEEINVLSKEERLICGKRISCTADIKTAVADVEFIQENGPESLEIKHSIISAIEEYNSNAIIASSTSGILVSNIAAGAKHPERIIGTHPYNPVYLIPLVEIAKGDNTAQETVDKTVRFYKEIGKEPIVLNKECPGFVCTRMQIALNREAHSLVYKGICSVEDVDKAVTFGSGLRWGLMGPHLIQELGGGPGGIRHQLKHIAPTLKPWFEDMEKWTCSPPEYEDIAYEGVKEELAHRTPSEGQDQEGLKRFRDNGLVMLLKYHGKL